MQRGTVADGVVDGGLAERMNADAPAAQPVGVDARGAAVLLDQPPGGLAVQVPPLQPGAVRLHRPKQEPLLIISDVRASDVSQDRPRRVKQDLIPTKQCRRVSADCEKATVRTNRDGGVKSPGNPRISELCPNCASLTPPTSIGGTFVAKLS